MQIGFELLSSMKFVSSFVTVLSFVTTYLLSIEPFKSYFDMWGDLASIPRFRFSIKITYSWIGLSPPFLMSSLKAPSVLQIAVGHF